MDMYTRIYGKPLDLSKTMVPPRPSCAPSLPLSLSFALRHRSPSPLGCR